MSANSGLFKGANNRHFFPKEGGVAGPRARSASVGTTMHVCFT